MNRVLIANRGEIASRIIRACHAAGLETVLAVSEADRDSLPARQARRTVCIGPAAAGKSYLDRKAIVAAALGTGADALHPGYGFLAESPALAALCAANGITFIGPRADHTHQMGNKLEARAFARRHGIPVLPGSEKVTNPEEAIEMIDRIGLPVMMKAAAGGGGRGMKVVTRRGEVRPAFMAASAEARSAFGDETLYFERFISNARHIEVQVLGDRYGNVIHLGERDCSLQRRYQKVIEEAPAPGIAPALREEIRQAAVKMARSMKYESAGTVEFIYDEDAKSFYFLEMNTRIQVEHPVTEMITGVDLVQQQLRVASGEPLSLAQSGIVFLGHAIECRITAELPYENFRPSPGLITAWNPPQAEHVRVDTHCYEGYVVPPYYDSLLAKLIVWGDDRSQAIERMLNALARFSIEGISTTLPFLKFAIGHPAFIHGQMNTRLVDKMINEMISAHAPSAAAKGRGRDSEKILRRRAARSAR
jgi:acetyl-CoA carboxylase, biotin carboxylase subunit